MTRGKEKKILHYLFLGKIVAGTHLALALKGIAVLAVKALMVAKIALVLASVVALKKLFQHEKHHTSYEVIQTEADHHDRVYDPSMPQLAYRGYAAPTQ